MYKKYWPARRRALRIHGNTRSENHRKDDGKPGKSGDSSFEAIGSYVFQGQDVHLLFPHESVRAVISAGDGQNNPQRSRRGEIGTVIQITETNAAMLALVNQIAQPNSEQNDNTVQVHDADIPYSCSTPEVNAEETQHFPPVVPALTRVFPLGCGFFGPEVFS